MIAIIINRPITLQEKGYISSFLDENTTLFTSPEINITFIGSHETKPFDIDEHEKKAINYEAMDNILSFGELKIQNKALTDIFLYEKISLWHYSKFRTYFATRNLLYILSSLKKIENKYNKVIYFGTQSELLTLYKSDKIEYQISPNYIKSSFNYIQLLKYLLFFILRVIIGSFRALKLANKKHLIIDHSAKQTVLDINTLEKKKDNYNLSYLFSKLDNEFVILDDINFPEKKQTYSFQFNKTDFTRKGRIYGELIIFKGLFSKKTIQNIKNINKFIRTTFNTFKPESFNFNQKIILYYFKHFSHLSLIHYYKYFFYKSFFSKHHFNSVSSIDENSPRIKSILDAAKQNGINTVGIQHGAIHELHPAFMFTKEDSYREIMPQLTIVWGNYWHQLLTNKGHYPKKGLKVAGQIRTDIIPKLLNSGLSKEKTNGSKKKIVLFASQPQRDSYYRKKTAFDIINSVKSFANIHLIIKLHPSEENDFEFYENIAKEVGTTNYSIVYWIDLYLLLSQSDLVITSFSTVGAEAIYFNKPLIILDYLKQDIQNYYKEGVAFRASNNKELISILNKLITNRIAISADNYNRFITKYAYKIDGKVSARIIKILKETD